LKKLQQYYIFKLESARLKESRYKIKSLTVSQARQNGELVHISNSQLVRSILDIRNSEKKQNELEELLAKKKQLALRKNNADNKRLLSDVISAIDDALFIPEIVNVQFDDKRHYQAIIKAGGFYVNRIRYVPFMSSAGQIRRNSSLFLDERIKKELGNRFDNGRDQRVEIVPAKFSAYYALYSSSSLPVSFPRLAVVPDLTLKSVRKVDYSSFIDSKTDPSIVEREMEIELNAFDGCGLVSVGFSQQIADELDINYLPSTFIVRAPYLKGMLVTFDFHKFSEEVADTRVIKDIYGNNVDVNAIDCIVSESMFKLWSSYTSTSQYTAECYKNKLDFGISKVSPAKEKSHCKSSYQFLQVLDLSDSQIEELCRPSLEWLDDVAGASVDKTLLYLLGETDFSKNWFSGLDVSTKALLYENSLADDSYFVNNLKQSIQRKKNDVKIGRLMFNGNYSIMIPDPYLYACHIFGLELKPILKEGQHYSHYWNERCVKQVAGIRSPIVHASEVNVLNFIDNHDTRTWYNHITTGTVFPASGIGMDSVINGGSDWDGDLIATINSPEIIAGIKKSLPIVYDARKAEKHVINEQSENLVIESQVSQIGTNKIGFYTNVSSSLYAMLYDYAPDSKEYEVIQNRLKYGRVLQGLAIDSAKGLKTDPFPEYWVKWKKITEDMTLEEALEQKFNNSIVADKRPYFMRWLYPHYNSRFKREIAYFNSISIVKWGLKFEDLIEAVEKGFEVGKEQLEMVARYKRRSFFINNNSTMCRVARYLDKKLSHQKSKVKSEKAEFNFEVLLSSNFKKPSKRDTEKIALLFKEYKSIRRSVRQSHLDDFESKQFENAEQVSIHIRNKALRTITSNATELADMLVYFCYTKGGVNSKSFLWNIAGQDILDNIISKKAQKFVRVPMKNPKGNIEYLWEKYSVYLMNVENI